MKLETYISNLPENKRAKISEMIHEASLIINSVECELHGTDMQGHNLLDGKDHPTLWCQLYDLHKQFKQ